MCILKLLALIKDAGCCCSLSRCCCLFFFSPPPSRFQPPPLDLRRPPCLLVCLYFCSPPQDSKIISERNLGGRGEEEEEIDSKQDYVFLSYDKTRRNELETCVCRLISRLYLPLPSFLPLLSSSSCILPGFFGVDISVYQTDFCLLLLMHSDFGF